MEKASRIEPLIRAEHLALKADVHVETIYRLCRSGKLPAVKIGKRWRIRREDAEVLLAGTL